MPDLESQYEALLARAVPGASFYEIQWQIRKAKGWSLIHSSRILNGELTRWPDRRLSSFGRFWNKYLQRFRASS